MGTIAFIAFLVIVFFFFFFLAIFVGVGFDVKEFEECVKDIFKGED